MSNLAINGGKPTVPSGLQKPWPSINQDDIDAVVAVLKRGVIWGPAEEEVLGLQEDFAKYVGSRYALVVNSGTAALHASVNAVDIGPGDEVITTAYSFWATAQAVLAQNAIPVFVDIEKDTYCIDPNEIEKKINEKTKAILPVHVHGTPCDMDKINAIAKKYNLYVIEDAAQAAGAVYKGRKAGTLGDMAAFSLNGSKNLPASEGGIVTTDNEELYERARSMSMFGEKKFAKGTIRLYDAKRMGFNYRNNEMADALCRSMLRRYDQLQAERTELAEYLNRELSKIKGVKPIKIPKDYVSSYHLYKVTLFPEELGITNIHPKRFRWAVQKALQEEGLDLFEWHNMPVPGQSVFLMKDVYKHGCPWNCPHVRPETREILYDPNDYPNTVDMFDRSFCIKPVYPPNTIELMQYYVEGFKKVFAYLDEVIEFSKTIDFPTMPNEKRII